MEKVNYYKLNPKLNKIGRLCKKCKDIYWKKNDCKSIEEHTLCCSCEYYKDIK